MTSGEHQQAPGPGPLTAEIELSSIQVELSLLDVLSPAFVRRHEALPYEVAGQTLRLVTGRPDALLLDEIAYCTGLRVEAAAPRSGGLGKVIEACIEAWSRGEKTFVTTAAGGAVADTDLVYLEDLGSLAASDAPSAPFTFGDAGDLAGLGSVGELADVGASAQAAPPWTAPAALASAPREAPGVEARVNSDVLPAVVDVAPPGVTRQPPTVPDGGVPPAPSAHATTLEAQELSDEELLVDVDLLQDVDLIDEEAELVATPAPSPWERSLSGVPDHRPAEGLTALLASGDDDERRWLGRVGQALGFAVIDANRTLDVLERLAERSADLLLLDADLMGTHSFVVARQLRAQERHANLAIVLCGNMARRWELVQDLVTTYGADGYLQKPYDTPTLLWTLEAALAARRAEAPLLRDPDAVAQAREWLSQGSSLYRKGAVDEALDLFRRGLDLDPFAARLHVSLAIALVKAREPYAAMESFERAITLDPTLTTAMHNLAVLYEKKGLRNKAFELWTQTLHATKDEEKRKQLRARLAKLM